MLTLLTYSGIMIPNISSPVRASKPSKQSAYNLDANPKVNAESSLFVQCYRQFASPQLVLAVLTLTTFHVQIITRLASGYPVWYITVAAGIINGRKAKIFGTTVNLWRVVVTWMVMYAVIQAGLFASFLPPA
jgi:GPI mannosyltransferase 2